METWKFNSDAFNYVETWFRDGGTKPIIQPTQLGLESEFSSGVAIHIFFHCFILCFTVPVQKKPISQSHFPMALCLMKK